MGEFRMSQSESLLIDAVDQLNNIKYYVAVSASKAAGKNWPKVVAGAPANLEKPRNGEKKPEKVVPVTKGKDLKVALSRMMNRAVTQSMVRHIGR